MTLRRRVRRYVLTSESCTAELGGSNKRDGFSAYDDMHKSGVKFEVMHVCMPVHPVPPCTCKRPRIAVISIKCRDVGGHRIHRESTLGKPQTGIRISAKLHQQYIPWQSVADTESDIQLHLPWPGDGFQPVVIIYRTLAAQLS